MPKDIKRSWSAEKVESGFFLGGLQDELLKNLDNNEVDLYSNQRREMMRASLLFLLTSATPQRPPSYKKLTAMIDRRWDVIAAECRPENKVALGIMKSQKIIMEVK